MLLAIEDGSSLGITSSPSAPSISELVATSWNEINSKS